MKKTNAIAALSVAALLSAAPMLASADDSCRKGDRDDRYEHRHHGKSMGAEQHEYSAEEVRIMAYGHALKRMGPGVQVSVDETSDGTYQVQLRDAEQNLIREQEFNQYGAPVRGGHRS